MKIGTRILYPEEAGLWDADILQISVYRDMKDNMDIMKACVRSCRDAGMPYVIHPVGYSLLQQEMLEDVWEMAQLSDTALILHDERSPEGERLGPRQEGLFMNALKELSSITSVSFENAVNTRDIQWFWDSYADSITLDIGHIESSGLSSAEFVTSLDSGSIEKIRFVHMHRNNGLHGNITDHWPLTDNCREVLALEELLRTRPDISVLLEINEAEETDRSLDILRNIRDRLKI
ncbi:MAG: hypothetical protein OEU95_01185 [Nitrospirota bacterium]|nr:hypothetical protein [Nitrospirota bacterium]